MLEVLVGKTIEQSLEEVMEEEELARLKAQQRAFEELRNNELAEVQRLQEQERRRREEKVGIQLTPEFMGCTLYNSTGFALLTSSVGCERKN